MNRLKDYTRLIRVYDGNMYGGNMYGGFLQPEEEALDASELIAYRDKLIEVLPSIDIDALVTSGEIGVFTPVEIALLKIELAKNTKPPFTKYAEFDPIYDDRTGLPATVISVLNAWVYEEEYGYVREYSASLIRSQNWVLIKLVEVLSKINNVAPHVPTLPPPTKTIRVGPKPAPITAFEEAVIRWLKNDPLGSPKPNRATFTKDYLKLDIQRILAYRPTDGTKITTLITELERCVDLNAYKTYKGSRVLNLSSEIMRLYPFAT